MSFVILAFRIVLLRDHRRPDGRFGKQISRAAAIFVYLPFHHADAIVRLDRRLLISRYSSPQKATPPLLSLLPSLSRAVTCPPSTGLPANLRIRSHCDRAASRAFVSLSLSLRCHPSNNIAEWSRALDASAKLDTLLPHAPHDERCER